MLSSTLTPTFTSIVRLDLTLKQGRAETKFLSATATAALVTGRPLSSPSSMKMGSVPSLALVEL